MIKREKRFILFKFNLAKVGEKRNNQTAERKKKENTQLIKVVFLIVNICFFFR